MQDIEEWRPISGYEEVYEISNLGRVRRLSGKVFQVDGRVRNIPNKILAAHINKHGYLSLHLSKNNQRKGVRIHRLVAGAFIPNPDNKPLVNHKDGNKLNNTVQNLEWCTSEENNNHAYATGLIRSNIRKYKNEIVSEYTAQGATIRGLSRKYSCDRDSIRRLLQRNGIKR